MIKKIILGSLSVLIFGVLLTGLIVYINQDVIINEVQQRLKQNGVILDVRNVQIDFLEAFPTVQTRMDRVTISSIDRSPFISSDELFIRLDLSALLSNRIEVERITMKGGHIQLIRESNGLNNYNFKSNPDDHGQSAELALSEIELIDSDFTFHDKNNGNTVRMRDIQTRIKPGLSEDGIELKIDLESQADIIRLGESEYVSQQLLQLQSELTLADQTLVIQPSTLHVADHELSFSGFVKKLKSKNPSLDLNIIKATGRVEKLAEFLPESWFKPLNPYQIKADYSLEARISGNVSDNDIPLVELSGKLSNAGLTHESLLNKVEKGNCNIDLHYGAGGVGRVIVKKFVGEYMSEPVKMSLHVNSFANPEIDLVLNGKIQNSNINPEFVPEILVQNKGSIRFDTFNIQVAHGDLHYDGTLQLEDVEGVSGGISFLVQEGTLKAKNDLLKLQPSKISALGQTHLISGTLKPNRGIYEFSIESPEVDLSRFFKELSSSQEVQAKPVKIEDNSRLHITTKLQAERLLYNDITFEHVQAKVQYDEKQVVTQSTMEYCEGVVLAIGSYRMPDGHVNYTIEGQNLNIQRLFSEWENFGQNEVKAEHIRGKGNFQCQLALNYKPGKKWDSKSLSVLGGIEIKDGQLIDVPLFRQFSSYMHIEDLKKIKFNRLSNVFRVANGKLELPQMYIQSSAANMILAGHHTLDNKIYYALKLNAGQILTDKIKKHDPSLQPVSVSRKGLFNLHYILQGPVESFEYKSDKEAVKRKFELSLFERDEILAKLSSNFDIGDRYDHPLLDAEIPELDVPAETSETEYIPGFD